MNKSIIPSPSIILITIVLYAMVGTLFFEMNSALEERENFVVDVDDRSNDNKTVTQQVVESQCKSPCPSSSEMCIEMCV
jgi:hypothetical protein